MQWTDSVELIDGGSNCKFGISPWKLFQLCYRMCTLGWCFSYQTFLISMGSHREAHCQVPNDSPSG